LSWRSALICAFFPVRCLGSPDCFPFGDCSDFVRCNAVFGARSFLELFFLDPCCFSTSPGDILQFLCLRFLPSTFPPENFDFFSAHKCRNGIFFSSFCPLTLFLPPFLHCLLNGLTMKRCFPCCSPFYFFLALSILLLWLFEVLSETMAASPLLPIISGKFPRSPVVTFSSSFATRAGSVGSLPVAFS